MKVTPQQVHAWYLEATAKLHPESFNPDAQKRYEELTDEQKSIDVFVADKINAHFKNATA